MEPKDGSLSERFDEALRYASQLHRGQARKETCIPYVSHLLSVSALVLEDGGNEDEAIAALLHDGPEDQGGRATLDEIRRKFGEPVADIVEACSDTFETPKPPWKERKVAHLHHLETASKGLRRVAAADKLHNVRSILNDHAEVGEAVWGRFSATKNETLWYYNAVVTALQKAGGGTMVDRLAADVRRLSALASDGGNRHK